MPIQDQWLLIRAGRYHLAAPIRQVHGVLKGAAAAGSSGEPEEKEAPPSLAALLGDHEEAAEGVSIQVRCGEALSSVRVCAAEQMLQGPELLPLPMLLRRALGEASPVLGAVVIGERPVLVVDLQRCTAELGLEASGGDASSAALVPAG